MRRKIEEAVKKALAELRVSDARFVVERPSHLEHGDYSTNAALVAKVEPQALAQKIKVEGIEKVEVAGRFINFFLSRKALIPHEEPFERVYEGKTVMVEYTDPNPFKEFHIGHLMSNAIGETIARLFEKSGASVVRANYQGDVGTHVAKALWGKMQKPQLSWGQAYVLGDQSYEAHKQEIDQLNKTIYEKSDPAVNKLYDEGRAASLKRFEEIYKVLGTKFDHYFFESESGPLGLKLIEAHPEVFEKSEGAVVFRGEHTRVFVNSQGLPTYEAKELGLVELKKQKGDVDLSLTVTANETRDFFKIVRQAAEKIFPDLENKMIVRFHGLMKLTEGKMSSRKGNVITGEALLEELKEKARGRMDVAVGAIKYAVLKPGIGKDIVFDPEKSLSLEGDSGPYLQYARVRAASLLRKAEEEGLLAKGKAWPSGLERPESTTLTLERLLIHGGDTLERAARELEPHHLVTYLTEVASEFNSWYAHNRVIGGQDQEYGLLLVQAVEKVLHDGLEILGIPVPHEM